MCNQKYLCRKHELRHGTLDSNIVRLSSTRQVRIHQERKGKKGIRVNPQSINKGGSDEENVGCQRRTGLPVTAAGTNEL